MDINTGEILKFANNEELQKELLKRDGNLIEINETEMTPKQKETMSVSLHDNKSCLGKKRIKSRREKNRDKRKHRI